MPLALGTAAIVLIALLCQLTLPKLNGAVARLRAARQARARAAVEVGYDPGRERRAERRARALLRSCVEDEDWAMYRDLGFLRVWGGRGARASGRSTGYNGSPGGGRYASLDAKGADRANGADHAALVEATTATGATSGGAVSAGAAGAPYAYLIYPHRPIVAYLPETGALLNEYCVAFPDHSKPFGSPRLPDSDDVLAKWMALTADERGLIADANMHLPGRQIDPDMVHRDLLRLSRWDRARAARSAEGVRAA